MGNSDSSRQDIVRQLLVADGGDWDVAAFGGESAGHVFTVALPRSSRTEGISVEDACLLAEDIYQQAIMEQPSGGCVSVSIQADNGCWVHFGSEEQLRIGPVPVFAEPTHSDWQLN